MAAPMSLQTPADVLPARPLGVAAVWLVALATNYAYGIILPPM